MRNVRRWLRLPSNLKDRRALDHDLDAELEAIVDELTAEHEARGLPRSEARRRALIALGGREQVKEAVRDVRTGAALGHLARDVRFALRSCSRARGYSLVAVLTLALGIGGATAAASLLGATLSDPDYPSSDRLVHVSASWPGGSGNFAYPDFRAMLEQTGTFEKLAVYSSGTKVALTGVSRPVMLAASFVSQGYLEMLGGPEIGRTFLPEENGHGAARQVVVVSHEAWRRELGGDPDALGRALRLNGIPYSVIGVMPAGFRDLSMMDNAGVGPDLYLPAAAAQELIGQPPLTELYSVYFALGRLRPGASLARAREDLAGVASRRAREEPERRASFKFPVETLGSRISGAARQPALALLAGTVLVLLLACVNLANATLVRLDRRRAELALRRTLGATSSRLAQQLLTETTVLALFGGVASVAVAAVLTHLLGVWVQRDVAFLVDTRLDGPALLGAASVAMLTLALFGALPVVKSGRSGPLSVLRGAGDSRTSPRRSGLRQGLVIAEVALAMALLVGAGLMVRSVGVLLSQERGFDVENLIGLRLDLGAARYPDAPARIRFARALEERLEEVPGVRSVALLGPSLRLGGATWVTSVWPQDRELGSPEDFVQLFIHTVNPGALETLGIPLVRGRQLDTHDGAEAPPVAVISEAVARQLWGTIDVVGRQLRRRDPTRPPITVVGVAADARHRDRYSFEDVAAGIGPGGVGPQRDIYIPYPQTALPGLTVAVRIESAARAPIEELRGAVASLDPDLPVSDLGPIAERLRSGERAPTSLATLFGACAVFALFLAALGIYGVIGQSVEQRTREIGIRLALGARSGDILARFVGRGTGLVVMGLVVGSLGAVLLAHAMSSLLFGIEPLDPATFGIVALVLLSASFLASFLPVRWVLGKRPMTALRTD